MSTWFRSACAAGAVAAALTAAPQNAAAITVAGLPFPTSASDEGTGGVVDNSERTSGRTRGFSDAGDFLRQEYRDTGLTEVAQIDIKLTVARNSLSTGEVLPFHGFLNGVQLDPVSPVEFLATDTVGTMRTFTFLAPMMPIEGDDFLTADPNDAGDDFVFEITVANAVAAQLGSVAFEIVGASEVTLNLSDTVIPLPASVLLLGGALAGLMGLRRAQAGKAAA